MKGEMSYLSISSRVIMEEARCLGLSVESLIAKKNFFAVSSEKKTIFFKSTDFGLNSSLGCKIADDKLLTQMILERGNFPHIKTIYVSQNDATEDVCKKVSDFSWPLVIKPLDGAHGDGVITNIDTEIELEQRLIKSYVNYGTMLIQEQIFGEETRVVMLDGKLLNAYTRVPAHIIGDGILTIKELIDKENKTNPLRGQGYGSPYTYLSYDDEVVGYLSKFSFSLDSIPREGQKVFLTGKSNIGSGGTLIDRVNAIPPSVVSTYADLVRDAHLSFVGLDVMVKSWDATDALSFGPILELNATSGIGGDREVTSTNTGKKILEHLFCD